jgi:hypothetical protein
MTQRRSARRLVLFAMWCALAVGCGSADTPVDSPIVLTPDEKVLLALDHYEPMYKVDADGRVTRLRMPRRHLPPEVFTEINKLTELVGLDLYGASVSDEGLARLTELRKLRNLGLGGTPISDKALVHIEKLQSLQYLWLPKNRVTKAGVEKLKTARPDLNVYLQ